MARVEEVDFARVLSPFVARGHHVSKFVAPPMPPAYVERPHLEARLGSASAPVSVVTGRAGAGKSALLSGWLATIDKADWEWVTLDAGDNSASAFWAAADVALHRLSEARFDQHQRTRTSRDAFLVLDDCHVLTADDARDSLAELVALLPSWIHLVLAGRAAPRLPLWRMRGAGRLVEIRDDELRLGIDEAMTIVAGSDASRADIVAVLDRTDGWATGLQLMTSGLGPDIGAEDAVREYLRREVFEQQPPPVQAFLMETACLEQLSPALCEVASGRSDAADVLHQLEQDHVFVSRDPRQYGRYRCHPQFRALLCDELEARDPDRARAVHGRVAQWFADHDASEPALDHWLAAGDVAAAIRILPEMHFGPADSGRVDRIRPLLIDAYPSTATAGVDQLVEYAAALYSIGQHDTLTEVLDRVDSVRTASADDATACGLAFLRGMQQIGAGSVEGAIAALERAETIFTGDDSAAHDPTLDVGSRLGHAQIWLAHGYRWLERPRDAQRVLDRVNPSTIDRCDLHFRDSARAAVAFARGNLHDADTWAQRAIARANELGRSDDITVRAAHCVEATLLNERGDPRRAHLGIRALIQTPVGPRTGIHAIRARLAQADLLRVTGHHPESLELLRQMRRELRPEPGTAVDSWLTRNAMFCLLAIGRLDAARSTLGAPPYPTALLSAAALLEIADRQPELAMRHLDSMPVDTTRRLLCASMIAAQASALRGDDAAVERHLRRVLRVGRREGFVRTVVDLVPNLLSRFPAICATPAEADYAALLREVKERTVAPVDLEQTPTGETRLSPRELEVLSYLPTRLSAREVAAALHVSLNTVKTHMHSIYRKLDSDSRDAAVERARVLHLLQ